jgi:phosphoenolpyruvate carboxykinase (GTP)
VPISAIIFGGRRAKVPPLVYQAFNWQHGVFVGASMASETTAAATGAVGVVRHDPMAMLPFCGYNMADYFGHWLDVGRSVPQPPKIFYVNWFRTNDQGQFLWPGFGQNVRVLKWILERVREGGRAVESPIGWIPTSDGIELDGLDLPISTLEALLRIDRTDWQQEVASQRKFFEQFGSRLPREIQQEHEALAQRLTQVSVSAQAKS